MNIKKKQIEIILVLVITAIASNLIIDLGLIVQNHPIYNQFLFMSIGYVCISKLLSYGKKYRLVIAIGQIFFVGLCIVLYYSTSFLDYITFVICSYVVISTIMLANQEKEERENYHV